MNVSVAQSDSGGMNWPSFMRRHAMRWDRVPTSWRDAPFLGNGMLGAMLHMDETGTLCLEIGRSDVAERRPDGDVYDGQHRLRIGRFRLVFKGAVQRCAMRLDLWKAQLVGRIVTDRGTFRFRAIVHAVDLHVAVDWSCSGDERVEWQWQPELAISPHVVHRNKPIDPAKLNPAPIVHARLDGVSVCTQPLRVGGRFATAWRHVRRDARGESLLISIGNDERDDAPHRTEEAASAEVNAAIVRPSIERLRTHRAWWDRYYPASVVSIPDARLETFYWIQIYKLACVTRADRQVIDLMGPWPTVTVWPGIWWNLNIQLCYYPVYAANRLELGESLTAFLDRNLPNFIANVKPEWQADSAGIDVQTGFGCRQSVEREFCNLAWTCHNYWWQYRYSMDASLLDRLYPLLSRAMNLYWHQLREEPDGKLHLRRSRSPEYSKWAEDTTINLALIRWGCATLLWMCEHQRRDEPLARRWRDMLERVVDYPIDANGYMIGRDLPFAESHRHYSHLLMIYPLYMVTGEREGERELIERSLRHWIGMPGGLQGYTFSGAASIFALLGNGGEAREMLNQCLDKYIQPNTFYCEWDSPVMETPLSIATSLQEMLLQSWGGAIRVMPAVPDDWRDVSYENLRAEGAFLVSATRRGGTLECVRVISLAGEPCVVHAPFDGDVMVDGPAGCLVSHDARHRFTLRLAAGESAVIRRSDAQPGFAMSPVGVDSRTAHFGLTGERVAFSR